MSTEGSVHPNDKSKSVSADEVQLCVEFFVLTMELTFIDDGHLDLTVGAVEYTNCGFAGTEEAIQSAALVCIRPRDLIRPHRVNNIGNMIGNAISGTATDVVKEKS
jgi:hypothetical protein